MIRHISIENFAIIEKISVDLHPGLNIITGETGAGKSIIIEAVSMTLGARADTTMVRSGHDKSIIQLVAENTDDGISNDTIISREISSAGKSLCKINGRILSLSELSKETQPMADIHGQYDHQSLLDRENHIGIVDTYSSEYIDPVKEKVSRLYKEYTNVKSTLDSLIKRESDAKRELDFLRFEINEIDACDPKPGEDSMLIDKIKILQNGEKIHDRLTASYTILRDSNPATMDQLGIVMNSLNELSTISSDFKSMEDIISESYYRIEELSDSIRDFLDKMDYSKDILNEHMSRLDALERLKSKYGGSLESVIKYRNEAVEKLDDIENIDDKLEELNAEIKRLTDDLLRESRILSSLRKKTSEELEGKIQNELNELNFSDASFKIRFSPIDNIEDHFSADGIDELEFLLSANKGLPPLPLAKIASGGEMSRIMLALKSITGDYDKIPTMIFDEIDSGISGITASIVGEKLLKMSKNHQIVCITHLPQIAACADHHFIIQKSTDDDSTYTTVEEISGEQKINEIARLLGGKSITDNTVKNAEELIRMARN